MPVPCHGTGGEGCPRQSVATHVRTQRGGDESLECPVCAQADESHGGRPLPPARRL